MIDQKRATDGSSLCEGGLNTLAECACTWPSGPVHPETMRRYCTLGFKLADGRVVICPSVRVGRRRMVPRRAFQEFKESIITAENIQPTADANNQ